MGVVVLRNFANDLMWALLALVASIMILNPSLPGLVGDFNYLHVVGGFLLITALPSAIVWSAFGAGGLKSMVPAALVCLVIMTTLSLALMHSVDVPSGMIANEPRILILGFLVFAGLKVTDFMFGRFRRFVPGLVKRILIVGDGPLARQMEELIKSSTRRYILLGRINCPATLAEGQNTEEHAPGHLLRMAESFGADQVVVSLSERRGVFPVEELLNCKLAGIEVIDAPSFYEGATRKLLLENITPSWFIFSHGFKVTWLLRFFKRTLDIGVSLLGLAFFAPFLPLIALAIRLDSPGPILFRQTRMGQGDRLFTLLKFRTMRQDAESRTGAVWSQENDPRVTRVGAFLRKTRLDEIPQLVNILKSDMSLVGPRPERPEFIIKLKKQIPYYNERHYVKPGLTGSAQVYYPYGSSVEDAIEKLRYDLYYIKNISILLDLIIISKTFGVVLLGKGR